jgi:HlyD family secretion protein
MRKYSVLYILLVVLISACTPGTVAETPKPVQPLVEDTSISASAKVVPETSAALGFNNGAAEVRLLISPGEPVTKGQVLAESDTSALEIALAQANSTLRQAQLTLEQLQKQPTNAAVKAAEAALINAEYNLDRAIDRGALRLEISAFVAARDSAQANLDEIKAGATLEQLEAAQVAIDQAQSSVDLAQKNLDQSRLTAPFDGQVFEIYLKDFETAAPGAPVLLLANINRLLIETTDLSETDVARISEGTQVKISFDAFPADEVMGTVKQIALKSAAGSGVNYTLTITSDALPSGLRWGMSAFIVINTTE